MPLSLMLVEDDASDTQIFKRMLSRAMPDGFSVIHAVSIEDALDQLSRPETDDLDAIVLDLGLPDSVGLTGLDRLSQATIKRIPIIILSGVDDEELAQQAVNGNAQDYINKQQMDAAVIDRAVRYAIERQRAQVELNASRERFRDFANIASDRFWEMDAELRFVDASGTLDDNHQPSKYDMLGHTLWGVPGFTPQSAESWEPLIEKMVQRKPVRDFEIMYGDGGESETYWAINASPIYSGEKFLGYRGTANDISLTRQIERELRASNSELTAAKAALQDLNARKDKFFSIIAHDLRSPFSSLMGAAAHFRDGILTADEAEAHNLGGMMYDTARRAYNLVDDLLQWSRLQLQQDALRPEKIKIKPMIDDVVELSAPSASDKKIELTAEVADQLYATIDHQAISTVLRNLVNNAIKFSDAGDKISVVAAAEDKSVVIRIVDTGVGMSEEQINTLRTIDQALSTKGTMGERGTGLGLVLCDELLAKSDGSLSIQSAVGLGTTVVVSIPRSGSADVLQINNKPEGDVHEDAQVG